MITQHLLKFCWKLMPLYVSDVSFSQFVCSILMKDGNLYIFQSNGFQTLSKLSVDPNIDEWVQMNKLESKWNAKVFVPSENGKGGNHSFVVRNRHLRVLLEINFTFCLGVNKVPSTKARLKGAVVTLKHAHLGQPISLTTLKCTWNNVLGQQNMFDRYFLAFFGGLWNGNFRGYFGEE